MKIGVLGTGKVGRALAFRFASGGHDVMLGSRDSQKGRKVAGSLRGNVRGGDNRTAAEFGEVVFIAWPRSAVRELIETIGPLDGKVLVDCTNPLQIGRGGVKLQTESPGGPEEVARCKPEAKVVKAFSTISSRVLQEPRFDARKPAVFCCGDDEAAKRVVAGLAEEIGFAPVDVGPLSQAGLIECVAQFVVHLDILSGKETEVALHLLRRRAGKETPSNPGTG